MRLRDYANKLGITYRTAYNHFKSGIIKARQIETGTIVVDESSIPELNKSAVKADNSCVLYARVSSSENKDNLDTQLQRLRNFATAKGYKIVKEVAEIGSGINDNRRKLLKFLTEKTYNIILVEHKDRFCRFGTKIIETLLGALGKKLEIINEAESNKEDITQDLISILTSYSAKIYGLRRTRRKTEKIIADLHNAKTK